MFGSSWAELVDKVMKALYSLVGRQGIWLAGEMMTSVYCM